MNVTYVCSECVEEMRRMLAGLKADVMGDVDTKVDTKVEAMMVRE